MGFTPYLFQSYLIFIFKADPPPTYDSLYGELKNARAESTGPADLVKRVTILFLSTGMLVSQVF